MRLFQGFHRLLPVGCAVLMVIFAAGCPVSVIDGGTYFIEVHPAESGREYRCFKHMDGDAAPHHFMSVVYADSAWAVRPHPGGDPNGWGSTWYPQPFFEGADPAGADLLSVDAMTTGVYLAFAGGVPAAGGGEGGQWTMSLGFSYDKAAEAVGGSGEYALTLDAPVTANTGDLNLYRIASNYLEDVPLLSGGTGDTGDMRHARVIGDAFADFWRPAAQPRHFPTDTTKVLDIEVVGDYNEVDTEAQGHAPIEPAYKPSLGIELAGDEPVLTFGALYDTSASEAYWQDNVGITPLIRTGAPGTNFFWLVSFRSTTPEP
ncbi:MAG: hypothetical protein ACLFTT_07130 [Candidatus Hydrogenedentota bacterium]